MENLPIKNYHEKEIRDLILQLWSSLKVKRSEKLEIKAVEIIYDMETVRKKIDNIYGLARRLYSYLEQKGSNEANKIKPDFIEEYASEKEKFLELRR